MQLHPSVCDVIVSAGYDVADPEAIRRLQAHHARPGASEQDLAILARRLNHRTDIDHARAEARHHRPSAAVIELDRIVLRALAPLLHEVADWHSWHGSGESLEVIASRSGADPVVVRLALHGLPGRLTDPTIVDGLDRAGRLWRSGAPVSEVAKSLGHSSAWLRRASRTGRLVLYPARLSVGDVAARAGVPVGRVATWARAALLPAPDGFDGRPWWWEPVITAWIEDSLPHTCPHCHARLPTLTGLRVHASKKHLDGPAPGSRSLLPPGA